MRKLVLIGSLCAAAALPAIASAQDIRCARDNGNQVAGAVAGAVVGGALGSGVSGRGAREEGTAVGAVLGAILGSQLARGQACPQGYRPYDTTNRRFVDYGPPPVANFRQDYWRSAPGDVRQRIDFMEASIRRSESNGSISRREADSAMDELRDIRRDARQRERNDPNRIGELRRRDREYIQARLDALGDRVRWMRSTDDYRRYGYNTDRGEDRGDRRDGRR